MQHSTAENGAFVLRVQIRKSLEAMLWGRMQAYRNKNHRQTAGCIYLRAAYLV